MNSAHGFHRKGPARVGQDRRMGKGESGEARWGGRTWLRAGGYRERRGSNGAAGAKGSGRASRTKVVAILRRNFGGE